VTPSSDMDEKEKSNMWLRQDDWEEIRKSANVDAQLLRRHDNRMVLRGLSHYSFRETYSNVYAVCNMLLLGSEDDEHDHQGDASTTTTIVSPEILTFMAAEGICGTAASASLATGVGAGGIGSNSSSTSSSSNGTAEDTSDAAIATTSGRGLEDRTAPRVAVERRLLRARQIKATLQVSAQLRKEEKEQQQKLLSNYPTGQAPQVAADAEEKIARVARAISRPSRKFAETLGLVDATAAIMVYTSAAAAASTADGQERQGHQHLQEQQHRDLQKQEDTQDFQPSVQSNGLSSSPSPPQAAAAATSSISPGSSEEEVVFIVSEDDDGSTSSSSASSSTRSLSSFTFRPVSQVQLF